MATWGDRPLTMVVTCLLSWLNIQVWVCFFVGGPRPKLWFSSWFPHSQVRMFLEGNPFFGRLIRGNHAWGPILT